MRGELFAVQDTIPAGVQAIECRVVIVPLVAGDHAIIVVIMVLEATPEPLACNRVVWPAAVGTHFVAGQHAIAVPVVIEKGGLVAAPFVSSDDTVIVAVQPAEPHRLIGLRLGLFLRFLILRLGLASVSLSFVR